MKSLLLLILMLFSLSACASNNAQSSQPSSESIDASQSQPAIASPPSDSPRPYAAPPLYVYSPVFDLDIWETDISFIPKDVMDSYAETGFVVYSKQVGVIPQNIELWNEWLDCYKKGERASVLLILHGQDFPNGAYELTSDGIEVYTIRRFNNHAPSGISYYSSYVLSNETQQLFGPEIEDITTNNILYIKPIGEAEIDETYNAQHSLGEISSQEALNLAQQHLKEYSESMVDYSGPADDSWRIEISGSVELYGHPCYVIRSSSVQYNFFWDKEMAVNADGGNLFFIRNEFSAAWDLIHDDLMVKISP